MMQLGRVYVWGGGDKMLLHKWIKQFSPQTASTMSIVSCLYGHSDHSQQVALQCCITMFNWVQHIYGPQNH